MNSLIGQSIIAELAVEYNMTVEYIETMRHPLPHQLAGAHQTNTYALDRENALGQLAAFRQAMQIVANQTEVNLVLPI